MAYSEQIQKIIDKLAANEKLTREEEVLYLKEVRGYSQAEIDHMFAINDNKDPQLLID